MKRISVLLLLIVAVTATSCGYQKYNSIVQDVPNEENERIYGVHPDSAAYQLKFEYPERPETQKAANDLRDKLFPKNVPMPVENTPNPVVE